MAVLAEALDDWRGVIGFVDWVAQVMLRIQLRVWAADLLQGELGREPLLVMVLPSVQAVRLHDYILASQGA